MGPEAYCILYPLQGPFPGKWTTCFQCELEVFISDTTVKSAEDKKMKIKPICYECSQGFFSEKNLKSIPFTESQKKEMESKGINSEVLEALGPNDLFGIKNN